MDNYIVSARKYRPSTFDTVVGQQSLTTTLKNAILNKKLAHAFLFCGPRGVGKTTCARIFAKTINCQHPTANGEPCNECESCRSFNEQRSLNIYELDAASNNSVEGIRSLTEQVRIPPQLGEYKVYIIDEVHMLSTAAFNAFLKTLEEPPHHAIFILATTEKQKIIPTILSRCQIYDFSRINLQDIVGHLENVAANEGIQYEPEALHTIAQKADGGMRDALSLFDQMVSYTQGNITYKKVIENLNMLDYEYFFRFTKLILEKKIGDTLLLFNEVLNKGFDGGFFISGLASHFRDLLVSRDEATTSLLEVGASVRQRYTQQAKECQLKMLYKAIKLCNDCDLNYRTCKNKRLLVELTLIQLGQLGDDGDDDASGLGPKKLKPIFSEIKTAAPQNNMKEQPQQTASTTAIPITTIQPRVERAEVPTVHTPGTGFSIKNRSVAKPQEDGSIAKTDYGSHPSNENKPFSSEDLHKQWIIFAQRLPKEQDALKQHMLLLTPQKKDETTYTVLVENEWVGEDVFKPQLTTILQFLRKEVHNGSLQFEIKINEEEVKRRAIRRTDQYRILAEKNSNIEKLKEAFSLDFL